MLTFPVPTSNAEKQQMINIIKNKLINKFGDQLIAIGAYGSIGRNTEMPYSDIEMHIVTNDGFVQKSYEFVYDGFKIELNLRQKSDWIKRAKRIDDSWAIWAGSFIDISPIYDPTDFFRMNNQLPLDISEDDIKAVMMEFMVWEPYETMGKIRNLVESEDCEFITFLAKDFAWQTAKLIGLANKRYYTTRVSTFKQSLGMNSKPTGYQELVTLLLRGNLQDIKKTYFSCEDLWTGLNSWFQELGIEYETKHLPF
ncbi:kanamycin nucleotidyltransferase C-terminal domain-containing protein [Litchfieldia alkalitelluris]|uniref:kanamycin nucleotidyltransferase C-terminal domain-containing protein n=1 Tax=Litchfieldia alkalitelluris TaxID=304268 RepID=UPI001116F58C|nr:kanamycin nucleotidyltransferase C-terminal domain-containing protein [Litchfieldia alkalitelluris]